MIIIIIIIIIAAATTINTTATAGVQATAIASLHAPSYRNVDVVHNPLRHDLAPVPAPERRGSRPEEDGKPAVRRPVSCTCDGPRDSAPATSTTTTTNRLPPAGRAEDASGGLATSHLVRLFAAWAVAGDGGGGGGGGVGISDGGRGSSHGCSSRHRYSLVSGRRRRICAGDGGVRGGGCCCWWLCQEGAVALERVHDRRPPAGSSIG